MTNYSTSRNKLFNASIIYFFAFQIINAYINFFLVNQNLADFIPTFWLINSIVIILALPVSGVVIDAFQEKAKPVGLAVIASSFAITCFMFGSNNFVGIIFAIYYTLFFSVTYWFIEEFFNKTAIQNNIPYQKLRSFGSISYAVSAIVIGYVLMKGKFFNFTFTPFNETQLFYLASLLFFVTGILIITFKKTNFKLSNKIKINEINKVFKTNNYLAFFFLIVIAYGLYSLVFKVYGANLFKDIVNNQDIYQQLYALKNFLSSILEAVLFFYFSRKVNLMNAKYFLFIGIICMMIRMLGFALPTTTFVLIFTETMHAGAFTFTLLAVFKIIEGLINSEHQYTAYAISMPIAGALMITIIGPIVNYLIINDILNIQEIILRFVIIIAITTAFCYKKIWYNKIIQ